MDASNEYKAWTIFELHRSLRGKPSWLL